MGKQSDWLVHHLHCKMSAMCFRFYCATNLLFKRYLSILCSLFKDMLIAKPHLIPRRTRRVEQCTVRTGFKLTSKAAFSYLVSSCTSVQSTLGPYVCSVHPISAKSILYQSSPPNISAKSTLYLPSVSYISQVKSTLYMLSPPYICHLLGNTNLCKLSI